MPYLFMFAAGVLIGKHWDKVKSAVAPLVGDASARFDALYSETARSFAQRIEDIEDRSAERRLGRSRDSYINGN